MSVFPPPRRGQRPPLTAPGGRRSGPAPPGHLKPTQRRQRAAPGAMLRQLVGAWDGGFRLIDADGGYVVGDCAGAATPSLGVVDPRFYTTVALHGSLGAGDAYVRGDWHSDDLVALMRVLARNLGSLAEIERPWSAAVQRAWRLGANLIPRTRSRSRSHIAAHYDLSNEFFAQFLDPTMTYSSGVFESDHATLQQASLAKYERLARSLQLGPSDRVVEIGCGWGGFAEFAATRFGCHVTGVTISTAQFEYAQRRIAAAKLTDRVDIRLCDYRDLTGRFDKLVSIEMIEAIGHGQLPTFFGKCCELLQPRGLMGLQAITIPDQRYESYRRGVDFIQKYIFPGGHLPSIGAMAAAVARATDLRWVHHEAFAEHYGRTLLAWRAAFLAAEARIAALGFDASFRRAWDYYFCSCAGAFFERQISVGQFVLARPAARGDLAS